MTSASSIGVLVEGRYLSQSQPSGLVSALRERGHGVRIIDPKDDAYALDAPSWLDGLDALVARGRSWELLALLSWADALGVPTINRASAVHGVFNKAEMSVRLAANALPAPATWIGSVETLARTIPTDAYPLIVKLVFGDNCRGLEVVESAEALAALEWPDPIAIAQRYFRTDGFDLKLYGIGGDVWGVKKPSPFNAAREGASGEAEAVDLSDEIADLGRRCGELFGLDLYGVDCIVAGDRVLVIEVNDYPNFTAVPNANERLAEFVARRAKGRRS